MHIDMKDINDTNKECLDLDSYNLGYNKALEHFLSVDNISKICHLITDWSEQILLEENVSPLAQEYLNKRSEILDIECYGERTERLTKLYNEYEVKFILENLML